MSRIFHFPSRLIAKTICDLSRRTREVWGIEGQSPLHDWHTEWSCSTQRVADRDWSPLANELIADHSSTNCGLKAAVCHSLAQLVLKWIDTCLASHHKQQIKILISFPVVGQQTTPPELPIFGDADKDIKLELVFQKIEPVFSLSGKTLQLLKPLDRDKDNLSHIIFQVCVSTFRNLSIKSAITSIFLRFHAPSYQRVAIGTFLLSCAYQVSAGMFAAIHSF